MDPLRISESSKRLIEPAVMRKQNTNMVPGSSGPLYFDPAGSMSFIPARTPSGLAVIFLLNFFQADMKGKERHLYFQQVAFIGCIKK